MKVGNGNIPLRIGNLIDTKVHGGPYRELPFDMFGVKMAVEIKEPCNVDIPTQDFNVPEVSDLRAGVVKALMAMMNNEVVYAGCMGGIGRTGLFLAALAKVQIEYRKSKHRAGRGDDPVLYVRNHFIPHAVETEQQKQFIADFDVSDIVAWLDMTQTAMGKGGLTPPKTEDLSYKGKMTPIYDDGEEIPNDFNPDMWDQYPDGDFPAEQVTQEPATQDQFDSLQNQIDEMQNQIYAVQFIQDQQVTKELTNPTLFAKIRRWFKK